MVVFFGIFFACGRHCTLDIALFECSHNTACYAGRWLVVVARHPPVHICCVDSPDALLSRQKKIYTRSLKAVCVFRYKHEIRKEDKEALQQLMRRQYHYLVTPEIHRELEASRWDSHPSDCYSTATPNTAKSSRLLYTIRVNDVICCSDAMRSFSVRELTTDKEVLYGVQVQRGKEQGGWCGSASPHQRHKHREHQTVAACAADGGGLTVLPT